ncbi:MAG: hypothetical protein ACI4UM_09045 [Succinivibrio sp.]
MIKKISVLVLASILAVGCSSTKVKHGKYSANNDFSNICVIHQENSTKRPSNGIFEQMVQNSFESFGIPSTVIRSKNEAHNSNCSHLFSYKLSQKRNNVLKLIKMRLDRTSSADRGKGLVGTVTHKKAVNLNDTAQSQKTITDLVSKIIGY